jgi:hypothetical protein
MLVVTTLSLVFASASLVGSLFIAAGTSAAVRKTVCGGDPSGHTNRQTQALQLVLFCIATSDVLGSLSWISTQSAKLTGLDSPVRCLMAGIAGDMGFVAMSLWTAVFAWQIRSVLTRSKVEGLLGYDRPLGHVGWRLGLAVWGMSALSTAALNIGHAQSCVGGRRLYPGARALSTGSSGQRMLEHVVAVCFLGGLPIVTISYCILEYTRVVCHYHHMLDISVAAINGADTMGRAASMQAASVALHSEDGEQTTVATRHMGPAGPADTRHVTVAIPHEGRRDGRHEGRREGRREPSTAPSSGEAAAAAAGLRGSWYRMRTRGFHLKLNRRLLSYLLAYIMCELAGVPAAVRWATHKEESVYHDEEESDPLVAMRVVLMSLQGAANAVVFAHHTGCFKAWGMGWGMGWAPASWQRCRACCHDLVRPRADSVVSPL